MTENDLKQELERIFHLLAGQNKDSSMHSRSIPAPAEPADRSVTQNVPNTSPTFAALRSLQHPASVKARSDAQGSTRLRLLYRLLGAA